jgi:hypothetical protein
MDSLSFPGELCTECSEKRLALAATVIGAPVILEN